MAEIYLRLQAQLIDLNNNIDFNYYELQALFNLNKQLNVNLPFPRFGGWAITAEFANILTEIIVEKKPSLIVELGSGSSTIIISQLLKKQGFGKLYTLEDKIEFLNKTHLILEKNKTNEFVEIIHAPLKNYSIDNINWYWYSLDRATNFAVKSIDLLIVDGPPDTTQEMARYPALPLLIDYLKDDALIILDDGYRTDETKIVKKWTEKFPQYSFTKLNIIKEPYLLKKM